MLLFIFGPGKLVQAVGGKLTSYLDLPRGNGSDACLMLEELCSVWGHDNVGDAFLRFRAVITKTVIVSKHLFLQ